MKSKILSQFTQFVLEVTILECYFLNHGQRILGVKYCMQHGHK
jgi:hypothetical protein